MSVIPASIIARFPSSTIADISTSPQEADPRQGLLDLVIPIKDLPVYKPTAQGVHKLAEWFGRMSRESGPSERADLFSSDTYKYATVRLILRVDSNRLRTRGSFSAIASDLEKFISKSSNNPFGSNTNIFPFFPNLNLGYTKVSGWTPDIHMEEVSDGNYLFSIVGISAKIVFNVIMVEYSSSNLTSSIHGYDGHGILWKGLLKGFGLSINEINQVTYPIMQGSTEITRVTLVTSMYAVAEKLGIGLNFITPNDLRAKLVDMGPFNLSCAELSATLESTEPNPSPQLLEFQNYVRERHQHTPFPPTLNVAKFGKTLTSLAESGYTGLKELERNMLSIHNSKELTESKLNDLCELTGLARTQLNKYLKDKVEAGLGAGKLSEMILISNVFTLAEKLGLAVAKVEMTV